MILFLALFLLLMVTLFYTTVKEGAENAESDVNTNLDTDATKIEGGVMTMPNLIQGAAGPDIGVVGNFILNETGGNGDSGTLIFREGGEDTGNIASLDGALRITGAGPDEEISLWGTVTVGSLLQLDDNLEASGDINLVNNTDEAKTNKITYSDMLEISGTGKNRNIKLADNVDISGNHSVRGIQTVNQQNVKQQNVEGQTVTGAQTIDGVSTHKGKIDIQSADNQVGVSFGNAGIGKNETGLSFFNNEQTIGRLYPTGLEIGTGGTKLETGKSTGSFINEELDTLKIMGAEYKGNNEGLKKSGLRNIQLNGDIEVTRSLKSNYVRANRIDSNYIWTNGIGTNNLWANAIGTNNLYSGNQLRIGKWVINDDGTDLRFARIQQNGSIGQPVRLTQGGDIKVGTSTVSGAISTANAANQKADNATKIANEAKNAISSSAAGGNAKAASDAAAASATAANAQRIADSANTTSTKVLQTSDSLRAQVTQLTNTVTQLSNKVDSLSKNTTTTGPTAAEKANAVKSSVGNVEVYPDYMKRLTQGVNSTYGRYGWFNLSEGSNLLYLTQGTYFYIHRNGRENDLLQIGEITEKSGAKLNIPKRE
jgi:hypothetical protein